MPRRKSRLKVSHSPVITISRNAIQNDKIVYILLANRKKNYRYKGSRVVYIGTTKTGAKRIGYSVVIQGEKILKTHGITEVEAFVVSCRVRRRVKIWKKLESALALTFRKEYGEVPKLNKTFSKKKETDEYTFFTENRLRSILREFE